jgi:hypothetical protein
MPPKFAAEYVDRLLADATYESLADLSSAICSSLKFNAELPDYGLPHVAFIFVETLLWFAQGERSGVWTYYEATPRPRQDAMLDALRRGAPEELSSWYERGMRDWSDEDRIAAVDTWIEAHGEAANQWLRALAANNREALLALVAE